MNIQLVSIRSGVSFFSRFIAIPCIAYIQRTLHQRLSRPSWQLRSQNALASVLNFQRSL
ncbi:MAG: hypothetical protein H0U72_02345 [Nitrosospira sp.]|nr:hypothetical protein [Nitrosospira sp.]